MCDCRVLLVFRGISAHISKPMDVGHLLNVFISPPSPLEAMIAGLVIITVRS